jgi:hypothetical protein
MSRVASMPTPTPLSSPPSRQPRLTYLQENWVTSLLFLNDHTVGDRRSLDLNRNRRPSSMCNNTRSPPMTTFNIGRLLLPSIMNVIDRTAQGSSPSRTLASSSIGSNDDVFDAAEVSTVGEPVEETVAEDVDEAAHWDYHGDSRCSRIGDCALNWREYRATCDTLIEN